MRATPRTVLPPGYAYVRIHLPWFPAYEGQRYAFAPRSDVGTEGGACEHEASHRTLASIDLREGTSLALVDALVSEWDRRAEDEPWPCACPNEADDDGESVEGEWATYVYARIPEDDRDDLPPRISPDDFGREFREWVHATVDGMLSPDGGDDRDGEAGL